MDIGVISVRYARALVKSSAEAGVEEQVYREMATMARSFTEMPQLRHTIDNPMLSREKKEELLRTAAGGDVSPMTARFISLVLKEGRGSLILFMANSFVTLYRKEKKIVSGKLVTAAPVTPSVEQRMRQMVAGKTDGNVEFETVVDPDIVGGFILEYDTYRLDASVKTKLNMILNELK